MKKTVTQEKKIESFSSHFLTLKSLDDGSFNAVTPAVKKLQSDNLSSLTENVHRSLFAEERNCFAAQVCDANDTLDPLRPY